MIDELSTWRINAGCYFSLPLMLRVTVITFNDIVESVILLNEDACNNKITVKH